MVAKVLRTAGAILLASPHEVDAKLLAMHCARSLLALVIWWLDNKLEPPAEQMGYLFWQLVAPGINDVLGIKMRVS